MVWFGLRAQGAWDYRLAGGTPAGVAITVWLPARRGMLSIGLALLIAGAWAAGIAGAAWGQVDHGAIVIDEVVGMLVAAAIPFYLLNQWIGPGALAAVSFLAFRVFDIAKPWPISLLDRRLKNGWGVDGLMMWPPGCWRAR